MKIAILALIGAVSATTLRQLSATPSTDAWREPLTPGEALTNSCVNANKTDFGADQSCDTAGNSAWNTHTTARTGTQTNALAAPYPDHTLHIQLSAETLPAAPAAAASTPSTDAWREPLTPGEALTNSCVNANNTSQTDADADQTCSTDGNSAWNTHSTARTASQTTALAGPYPDHTLH